MNKDKKTKIYIQIRYEDKIMVSKIREFDEKELNSAYKVIEEAMSKSGGCFTLEGDDRKYFIPTDVLRKSIVSVIYIENEEDYNIKVRS